MGYGTTSAAQAQGGLGWIYLSTPRTSSQRVSDATIGRFF